MWFKSELSEMIPREVCKLQLRGGVYEKNLEGEKCTRKERGSCFSSQNDLKAVRSSVEEQMKKMCVCMCSLRYGFAQKETPLNSIKEPNIYFIFIFSQLS